MAPATSKATPNILVVEDDRETRALIAKYLRSNSCNVTTAGEHTGGIADSHWSATRIQLQSGTRSPTLDSGFPGFAAGPSLSQATSGATTSKLSGDSFSVAWQAASDSPSSSVAGGSPSDPAEGQFPAFGNPPG